MKPKIEKASEIGFCYGVRRAVDILEKKVKEHGKLQTLGAVVHNEQVMQSLAEIGINVIYDIDNFKGNVIAISSHGVVPEIESELRRKKIDIIDTTCPFVRRAQISARRLAEAGFYVVIYGETKHPEVKGILGWASGNGVATLDVHNIKFDQSIPRRIGILSQTTQIPEKFTLFVKDMLDLTLTKDVEIRILDTICHDIRKRQSISLDLAKRVDLMLVIGGHSSANTRRLLELCSEVTETHLIDRVEEIDPSWLKSKQNIGITSGTSTSVQTIDQVFDRLTTTDDGRL
jgi:4-hydroxy-3-methylbut-2-en-1-yl diphosphate reductase